MSPNVDPEGDSPDSRDGSPETAIDRRTLLAFGAAGAALLFGGLDMLQIQYQTAGDDLPNRLVNLFPYATVIVVLTLWGSTRMPAAVGEPYESEE